MNTCEWCDRTREDVEHRMDPYIYEIHDERVFSWFCDDCHYQRRLDV